MGSTASFSDSGLINYSSGLSIENRDSHDANLVGESDIYSTNAHYADNPDSMSSATVVTIKPGTVDQYQETTMTGSDFAYARSLAQRVLPSGSYLRASMTTRSDATGTLVQEPRGLQLTWANFSFRLQVNCDGHIYNMSAWLVVAGIIMIVGCAVLAGPFTAAAAIVWGALGSALGESLYELVRWGLCRLAGSLRATPSLGSLPGTSNHPRLSSTGYSGFVPSGHVGVVAL